MFYYKETKESYFIDFKEAFKGWGEYLSLAVPGTVMLLLEWWLFELYSIFSGYFNEYHFAANVIIMNYATLWHMFPMGVSIATSTLVGNAIGENNVPKAKVYFNGAVIFNTAFCTALAIITYLCSE